MDEDMIATIKLFAGNFAPLGWFFCDGSLLPISQYQALYSLLGTMYGGDGRTTFGLPDLRGRVPMGTGQGQGLTPHNLGQKSGTETNVLTSTNTGVSFVPSASSTGTGSMTAVPTGQNAPVNNVQPSLALNYIICWQGLYPMRP
jgi:microcystin-dependent protein